MDGGIANPGLEAARNAKSGQGKGIEKLRREICSRKMENKNNPVGPGNNSRRDIEE